MKKFATLQELLIYLVMLGSLGAAAVGGKLATEDAFPQPRSVAVHTLAPHSGAHDHAHDMHGHAVDEKEVTIDLEYGARATDSSGDVAVSRRGIHAHAVRGEDGMWQIEALDQVRFAKDERHSTSDPEVWEKSELAGELPHGDAHDHGNHDDDANDDDHGHGHGVSRSGIID